jgi:hypothetical protein
LGDRVLRGAEWDLFREALAGVWELVEESFDGGTPWFVADIAAFDYLQPGQKLALLALVGKELRNKTTPTPEHTAHNEAAIAAVFEFVRKSILVEIDDEAGTFWRGLVLAAYRGTGARRGELLPAAACDDPDEWEPLIRGLADRILGDDDYAMSGDFLDFEPRKARDLLAAARIEDDYYVAAAPDPAGEELEQARRTLRQLTGRRHGPQESELLPGLEDTYHGLLVGPCDAAAVDAETACRLVREVEVLGPEGFDCSYREWAELFRGKVLRVAQQPQPPSVPASVLSPGQRAEIRRAQKAGTAFEAGEGHRVEPCEGGWVVADAEGRFLAQVDDGVWSDEDDPDLPPLVFPTAAEALAAFVRSDSLAHARASRRKEALRRLGRG